ncbi:MAG: hypothetical protein EOO43_04375, partial [Flavobacterium sp.]
VIGTGGSSLSSKALINLNIYNSDIDIKFLENIDPIITKRLIDKINFSDTVFLVISKSGETFETIALVSLLIDEINSNHKNYNFQDHFHFITSNKMSKIRTIALSLEANIYDHDAVGGRFSAFTNVGLLISHISGLDIYKIRFGAKLIIDDLFNLKKDSIIAKSVINIMSLKNKINNIVTIVYSDQLIDFNMLNRQIWAESTGKMGEGITPITAIGTIDQHSQLQLYLDGPKDKLFHIITIDHNDDIPLSKLIKAERQATIENLISKNIFVKTMELQKLDEIEIGMLVMQSMLESILFCKLNNINPFNQDAVEINKKLIADKLI